MKLRKIKNMNKVKIYKILIYNKIKNMKIPQNNN